MKKIVTLLIFGLMSLASCTEYDEVAMWNKNEDMGSRLAALEVVRSDESQHRLVAADRRSVAGQ